MQDFSCGCSATVPGAYCDAHLTYTCHTVAACGGPDGCSEEGEPCPVVEGECPPCYRGRLMSIGLDRRATPSRTFRPSRETKSLEGVK